MWDVSKLVLIQKAWHALHDGRIDEAFEIASREELRDHRKCQVLLEKLVPPLLERARSHLAAGRLEIGSTASFLSVNPPKARAHVGRLQASVDPESVARPARWPDRRSLRDRVARGAS